MNDDDSFVSAIGFCNGDMFLTVPKFNPKLTKAQLTDALNAWIIFLYARTYNTQIKDWATKNGIALDMVPESATLH